MKMGAAATIAERIDPRIIPTTSGHASGKGKTKVLLMHLRKTRNAPNHLISWYHEECAMPCSQTKRE